MIRRLALLALVVCGGAPAAPGDNGAGHIAFTRYRFQNAPLWSEIWVANPDGSGAHRVSHSAKATEDDGAHFSPDGKWIVFTRCTPATCWPMLVHPDGTGQHAVHPTCERGICDDSQAAFTADGAHLVFVHEWGAVKQGSIPNNDQIDHSWAVTTDLQGGHRTILRRMDGWSGGIESPRVSPDGTKLLYRFYGWNRAKPISYSLRVGPLHGAGGRSIAPMRLRPSGGEWSPDSKTLLFRSTFAVGELTPGNALYTVGANGNGLRRVSNDGGSHYVLTGAFSPDGQSVVYSTDNGAGGFHANVVTLRLDTGARTQVTHDRNLDGWPTWGP